MFGAIPARSLAAAIFLVASLAGTAASAEEAGLRFAASRYAPERPHHFSVLLGGTEVDEEDVTVAFTLGGDYEYRVNALIGVGGVLEHAFGRLDATSLLGVVDVHLLEGLALQIGPGIEFTDEDDVFITRVGLLYEVEYGAYTVSPQLHYDIHSDAPDAVVFGMAFGKAF